MDHFSRVKEEFKKQAETLSVAPASAFFLVTSRRISRITSAERKFEK